MRVVRISEQTFSIHSQLVAEHIRANAQDGNAFWLG